MDKEKCKEIAIKTDKYIKDHPHRSMGVALSVGLVLGTFVGLMIPRRAK